MKGTPPVPSAPEVINRPILWAAWRHTKPETAAEYLIVSTKRGLRSSVLAFGGQPIVKVAEEH